MRNDVSNRDLIHGTTLCSDSQNDNLRSTKSQRPLIVNPSMNHRTSALSGELIVSSDLQNSVRPSVTTDEKCSSNLSVNY